MPPGRRVAMKSIGQNADSQTGVAPDDARRVERRERPEMEYFCQEARSAEYRSAIRVRSAVIQSGGARVPGISRHVYTDERSVFWWGGCRNCGFAG